MTALLKLLQKISVSSVIPTEMNDLKIIFVVQYIFKSVNIYSGICG